MLITSLNNSMIKQLVKLKEKKYRDLNNEFFIEGEDLCTIAYEKRYLKQIYIIEGYDNPYKNVPCTYITKEIMKKISDMESISPYFGICSKKEETQVGNKIIILDDIQDPGNLGTIIRSAVAFNFDTIVLSEWTVDLYNPKVIRSTKGMLFKINIILRDIPSFIKELTDYQIYGTDVIKGVDIKNENIPSKLAIIIGNEGRGISEEIRSLCHKFIYIKMNNECESLNAGVSASILMYEVNNK